VSAYAHTIEIARPPEHVFAFVSDPQLFPSWQPSLVSIRPHVPGPLRPGTAATEVRRFLGRELETTWTCVEHEPHDRSAIESSDGAVPFRGTFELEPVPCGTRFTWTIELLGAAARLAGPLAGRVTRSELRANCDRLKELLEAPVAPDVRHG
jgi:carbon monoxide dehydrogenase subunit G